MGEMISQDLYVGKRPVVTESMGRWRVQRSVRPQKLPAVRTILVVDDDPDMAELLGLRLQDLGHKIVYAWDGVVATVRAQEYRPDLLITDIKLPGADGATVYQRIQQFNGMARLPVIFVTAFTSAEAKTFFPESPLARVLPKPPDFARLGAYVEELLSGSA